MIAFMLLCLLAGNALTLSGSAASAYCHCDLTSAFCDVGCCCDADCSGSVAANCYNLKSNSYCPDPTFFSRLGTTYLNSQGCFYYNSTDTVVEEVSLATRQATQIISQKLTVTQASASAGAKWAGYFQGDILQISGTSDLNLISSVGACLTAADSTAPAFSIRFGLNMKIACTCTGCTTVPQLFSALGGKTVNQFSGDTSKPITLPTITDAAITDLQITFVIGTYGSQGIRYIERVTSSSSSNAGSSRSLTINFVQPSQVMPQVSSPTFFPQIPSDMFYPIYLLS